MSRLKFPLKETLRDPADEGALQRMWQSIDARFPRRRSRLSLSLILAPVAAAAAGVAVVAYMHHDAGPLRLVVPTDKEASRSLRHRAAASLLISTRTPRRISRGVSFCWRSL